MCVYFSLSVAFALHISPHVNVWTWRTKLSWQVVCFSVRFVHLRKWCTREEQFVLSIRFVQSVTRNPFYAG